MNKPVWYEPYSPPDERKKTLRNIKCDNIVQRSIFLPTFSAPNLRSLGPKIRNFTEDFRERKISVAFCSETWGSDCKVSYQNKLVKMLEMEGYATISLNRKVKRGGGVCFVYDPTSVSIRKLDVQVPEKIEILWGLIRPKEGLIKNIIAAVFYYPPASRMKKKFSSHIISTLTSLMNIYQDAEIFIAGDKNKMDFSDVFLAFPRLKNIQVKNTYRDRNLDWMLTTMCNYYQVPIVVKPVSCDKPLYGKPSDHLVPVVYPLTGSLGEEKNVYTMKICRPMPESGINYFINSVATFNWNVVLDTADVELQDKMLLELLNSALDNCLPMKKVRMTNKDKFFITKELKVLDRARKREYCRHGKTDKFFKLKLKFDNLYKKEAKRFLDKNVNKLKKTRPGQAFRTLKRLGARPGEDLDNLDFILPDHMDRGLSAKESAEEIVVFFSSISQEYPPVQLDDLPSRVKNAIKDAKIEDVPDITEDQVSELFMKAKKTKTPVIGDIPCALYVSCIESLKVPIASIYNNVATSGNWPLRWRTEEAFPLKKTTTPLEMSDLRTISKTPFLATNFEKIVLQWMLGFIGTKIDWAQFGGQSGCSVSHVLIELETFIEYNHDLYKKNGVFLTYVDYDKAFNRQNHGILLTVLHDLGIPGWLNKIILGFLKDRYMFLKYKNEFSSKESMPGGGAAGTIFGFFLFIILLNDTGRFGEKQQWGSLLTSKLRSRKPVPKTNAKWVDDVTLGEAVPLNKALEYPLSETWTRPVQFRQRRGFRLKPECNETQKQVDIMQIDADRKEMLIKDKKCSVMPFNSIKRKCDFQPEIVINSKQIKVVEEAKVLGVILESNLSFKSNTKHIQKKAHSKMWLLRRLKRLGASKSDLLDVYYKHIRSQCEHAVPVWNNYLTKKEANKIEGIQRVAIQTIFDTNYRDYRKVLKKTGIKSLSFRRKKLCLNFAIRSLKHKKFNSWFVPEIPLKNNIYKKQLFKPVIGYKKRLKRSPIGYLTELLNNHNKG